MGSFLVTVATLVTALAFGAWVLWSTDRQRCRPGKAHVRCFASYSLASGSELRALPVLVVEVRNQRATPLQLTLKRGFTFRAWLRANLAPERVGQPELIWAPLDHDDTWSIAPGERRNVLLGLRLASFPSSLQRVEIDWTDTRSHRRRLPGARSVRWRDPSGTDTWGAQAPLRSS